VVKLSPQKLLECLPPEEIERFLKKQKGERSSRPHKPRKRK